MAKLELQFWKSSKSSAGTSVTISVLLHAALISASVVSTLPEPGVPPGSLANRVYYLPPPNRVPAQRATRETIHYIALAPIGEGNGFGLPATRADRKATAVRDLDFGDSGRDSATSVDLAAYTGTDSVFTLVDVDTAAKRLAESAAPKYPKELLEKRVEGSTLVQFVVDTTGFADTTSFRVVTASQPEFAKAVREALPQMRFASARIGDSKVRQLVELPFTFNIATPPPTAPAPTVEATASRRRRRP
jgi:TonB family protein